MERHMVYCTAVRREVQVGISPDPTHEGQAPLHDAEVVCLEAGDCCFGRCPVTGELSRVMALRLAKSGERPDPVPTARLRCTGCGEEAELELVDRSTLLCPLCGTVNRWIMMQLVDQRWIPIGRPDAEE